MGNNPVSYTDPLGLDIFSDGWSALFGSEPTSTSPGRNGFFTNVGNWLSDTFSGGDVDFGQIDGRGALFGIGGYLAAQDQAREDDGPIEGPDVSWLDTPMSQENVLGWTVNHDPFIYAKTGVIYTVPPSTPLQAAQQTAIVGTPIVFGLMAPHVSQWLFTWALSNPLGAQDVMEEIGYGIGGVQRPTSPVVPLQTSAILEESIETVAKPGGSVYDGVRATSEFLQEQGVPREYRQQILQSFEVETISLQTADNLTFGLRFYGDRAGEIGR